jgi:transcription antitermination factor NusG
MGREGLMLSDTAISLPQPLGEVHWYALWTAPRHEKKVVQHLQGRNVEVFLPVYQAEREWKKRPMIVVDLPLFPGYVFARIDRSARGIVLGTPGVHSIVGNGKQHLPVSDAEISILRSSLPQVNPEPHPFLDCGANIVICRGALKGMEGVLVRKKGAQRVVISITSIHRAFSVEVDAVDLKFKEPAGGMHNRIREIYMPDIPSSQDGGMHAMR